MHSALYIYPWDIIDDGIEECIGHIGSLGLDGVHVAVNYHTAKILLPHNPKRGLFFTEPGAVFFPPDPEIYPPGLVPPQARLTRGTTFLDDLMKGAHEAGMDVTAWTVCMHNTRLGFMNPAMTVENALGDRLLHNLCPANPLSRAYVLGIVSNVTSMFGPDAVELETPSFLGFTHGYHHEIAAVEISQALDFLLSLCFCPFCMERANERGIDTGRLLERVAEAIRREIDAPCLPKSAREVVTLIPGLEQFTDCRADTVTSFVDMVKNEACRSTRLITIATVFPPNADARLLYGADPFALSGVCDMVSISGYFDNASRLAEDLDLMITGGLAPSSMRVGLRPQLPDARTYENFLEKLTVVAEAGAGGVTFYNYGTMRKNALTWIHDGLKEISA